MARDIADIEAWLAGAATGDRAAFGQLYDATCAKLYGTCLRVLRDREEAEEALQEVYVKIWDNAHRYRSNGLSPITWMAAVTRNHCIDRLRARGPARLRAEMPQADLLADPGPGPEARAIAQSEAKAIRDCLGELPPERSDAVRGAYLEGETYADLAARFEVPLNTMRTWLRRSLIALRDCLAR
ncbi:MAG: sigma-70 family RNA polymerase sigma factor [Jannaschia sp.]